MDARELFVAAQRAFGERVEAVTDEQWTMPTPCADWSVTDLVSHLLEENLYFPPLLRGDGLGAARSVVDASDQLPSDGGAQLVDDWNEASAAAVDALDDDASERDVELVRGSTPAPEYVAELTLDHVVHAWDLAKAVGYPTPLPDDLVRPVYEQARDEREFETDMFATPVEVADDAPLIERLVALTGRDPSWRAGRA